MTLCNARSLEHLLSQFLLTDHYTLVLSTLDNLPRPQEDLDTRPQGILCHHRELRGSFVAPEQKWLHGDTKIFNLEEQPRYDQSVDIWKVPEVTSALLGSKCEDVMDYLRLVHVMCKALSPHQRPTAQELLSEYKYTWNLLFDVT